MASDPCVNCHEAEGKYKCPQCTQRTCSVACSKKHKESHPPQEAGTSTAIKTDGNSPSTIQGSEACNTADASTSNTQSQKANDLADMPEYKMLMTRYPQLLNLLSGIAAATDPPTTTSTSSLTETAAGNTAPRYTGKKQEPWTPDIGIQKGMEVLKSARQARGTDSEGIREFIELHRLWQARQQEAAANQARTDREAAAAARKKLAEADAQAIKELLEKEKASAR
ncbi:uncharacterized protein B0I36DRAFT_10101 [Microdochium trichocladiopsis]|uniref:HIT-type domain-containing protein n=1 Tax=Microdochium trichocladiopsis TaxID=1682393 RepID=A0A9P9BTW7_9PEZI|nr:uncharacterized protein B0I36DRAFT_10101 [Microdochium trichocladiopsis]KAH7040421.1 hypothetical protein B0I36DRAFT_10101 [Microdochium trichocladiopsis]